jgi:hypothetical protein
MIVVASTQHCPFFFVEERIYYWTEYNLLATNDSEWRRLSSGLGRFSSEQMGF